MEKILLVALKEIIGAQFFLFTTTESTSKVIKKYQNFLQLLEKIL